MTPMTFKGFFERVKRDIRKEMKKTPKYLRSSRAARVAYIEIDSAIKGNQTFGFSCSRGCSYCCHLHTDITAGEAFVLAKAVRLLPEDQREDVLHRLKENAENLKQMSYTDRMVAKVPCALLDLKTNACSVYESRPTNCRKWHSLSVSACKADFDHAGGKQIGTPLDPTATSAANLVYEAYKEATGEPMGELHQGVLMAMDPESESRYAKGAPVFEGWTETNENATEEELTDARDQAKNLTAAAVELSRRR